MKRIRSKGRCVVFIHFHECADQMAGVGMPCREVIRLEFMFPGPHRQKRRKEEGEYGQSQCEKDQGDGIRCQIRGDTQSGIKPGFIFEETGVLIGNALKSAQNKEALFGGVLGIRHFCKDDAQYYYSGYLGKSINRSFPHACRIRKVCSTGQTLQFQRYLPLLEVDFIRANGWTVIPFPFKYLREWRLQQG